MNEAVNEDLIEENQPIARVHGRIIATIPQDLYIPPDALEVILEAFEGPLDLLLYLIRHQNLDILDIPVAKITEQYIQYIELMQVMKLELAGEYLLMAAMLVEIKSRMLLPRPIEEGDDENDPRAELIQRLQEYKRFKKAAQDLDELPRVEREIFPFKVDLPEINEPKPLPQIELKELLLALRDIFERTKLSTHHHLQKESLSIRERMTEILQRLNTESFTCFSDLFNVKEGRAGVVVTFIAVLELLRQPTIEMVQSEPFAPIHMKALG